MPCPPPQSRRAARRTLAPTRSRRSTARGTGPPRRWCWARSSSAACCGTRRRPRSMAAWLAAILANQAWRGVLARAYRRAQPVRRRRGALGLATGPSARRWPARCGARPPSRCFRIAGLPGAVHRLPVRRDPRRAQPHRGLQAVVLRLRAGGAGAADRARRARGRPGAPVHGAACWASCSGSCWRSAAR